MMKTEKMSDDSLRAFVPAKINLGLNIVSRRDDGYHNLETVFFPVPLYDELMLRRTSASECGEGASLSMQGLTVVGDVNDNLVMRAYRLLCADFPSLSACHLHFDLKKHIPTQAGMGGGSADASYALLLLDRMFDLHLTEDALADYALRLGADCPFFVRNAFAPNPSQAFYGTGVGEMLRPVALSLQGYRLVVVKPDVAVSTREAFSRIVPQRPSICCADIIRRPLADWRASLRNDFEESVFALYPELLSIKRRLYAEGAVYAAMSGSGSAIFGVFSADALPSSFVDAYILTL